MSTLSVEEAEANTADDLAIVAPGEPVANDDLIRATRLANADGLPRSCDGCARRLEINERFVALRFQETRWQHRLCRYCVLKLHRIAETTDV